MGYRWYKCSFTAWTSILLFLLLFWQTTTKMDISCPVQWHYSYPYDIVFAHRKLSFVYMYVCHFLETIFCYLKPCIVCSCRDMSMDTLIYPFISGLVLGCAWSLFIVPSSLSSNILEFKKRKVELFLMGGCYQLCPSTLSLFPFMECCNI